MQAEFYDVKAKAKVSTEVTAKVIYMVKGRERYAFKGVTADGRNLTKFVSKDDFDACDAEVVEAPPKK